MDFLDKSYRPLVEKLTWHVLLRSIGPEFLEMCVKGQSFVIEFTGVLCTLLVGFRN
jgi:hypothetical protein